MLRYFMYVLMSGLLLTVSIEAGFANSMVVDGPGFKVQQNQGWFGSRSTQYQDALGNQVERKKNLWGRQSSKTKVFGAQATQSGNNVTVKDANGRELVSTKRTWFHGKQTHVDGNAILNSVKGMF